MDWIVGSVGGAENTVSTMQSEEWRRDGCSELPAKGVIIAVASLPSVDHWITESLEWSKAQMRKHNTAETSANIPCRAVPCPVWTLVGWDTSNSRGALCRQHSTSCNAPVGLRVVQNVWDSACPERVQRARLAP